MTASAPAQPRTARRERTIIERPRLIRLLDETSSKTVLLLAPAGYGKTTLARQWAKTLQRVVWVSLAPAHRDVAALAHDFAVAIDAAGGQASGLIGEHLKAKTNPQLAARELGRALAGCLQAADARWLILDEYENLVGASATEQLVETVARSCSARIVLTTRVRPEWSTGRSVVYGDVEEIVQADLAMTEAEVTLVLKPDHAGARIAERAKGWPAVVGLAAAVEPESVPLDALPDALHRYLAEELYQRASIWLQEHLVTLALLSDTSQRALEARFGDEAARIVTEATDLGFGSGDAAFEMHPLLRDFLLSKLAEHPDVDQRVDEAIAAHLNAEAWDRAFELITRFERWNDIDHALSVSFRPMVRSGRLETLASFVSAAERTTSFPLPSVEVALAELALRAGRSELARGLATRAERRFDTDHPLSSCAAAIAGQAAYIGCDWTSAVDAYDRARARAQDERDEADALFGVVLTHIYGELPDALERLDALADRRHSSPYDLVRYVTAAMSQSRVSGESCLVESAPGLADAQHAAAYVDDPRARSSLFYTDATRLTLAAHYGRARESLDRSVEDIDVFGLEFAVPFVHWLAAQIALGQRRFSAAERALQMVEDSARGREPYHATNVRCLRARLLLQNGELDQALTCVQADLKCLHFPAWEGEYLATRALALGCLGLHDEAISSAELAVQSTIAIEVHVLAQTAKAIVERQTEKREGRRLIEMAGAADVWDPVICGLRSSPALADQLASDPLTRSSVADLYQRTQETALARRAGLKLRAVADRKEVLTQREREVLELIARGFRTQDISHALFIAESTAKVHIRHIFEKLGARTRSEAVARYQMYD